MEMSPGAQKGFLGDILRILRIAKQEIGKPENCFLVETHQRFPGCRVTIGRITD
jgi:hypothetical protein